MQIFHIAEAKRWEAARLAGSYAQSRPGRTLEQEGCVHACRADQLEEVRTRYADASEPLVLLVIDTDRLSSRWSEDPVGDDTYPRIHGPLNPSAVVGVLPLGGEGTPAGAAAAAAPSSTPAPLRPASHGSLAAEFAKEMAFRMGLALMVMALTVVGAAVTGADAALDAPFPGAVGGFLAGLVVALLLARQRNRRLAG